MPAKKKIPWRLRSSKLGVKYGPGQNRLGGGRIWENCHGKKGRSRRAEAGLWQRDLYPCPQEGGKKVGGVKGKLTEGRKGDSGNGKTHRSALGLTEKSEPGGDFS